MPRTRIMLACFILLGPLLAGGSCCVPYDIEVALHESLRDPATGTWPSLEVDLVGVNDGQRATWVGYPISRYFDPGNRTSLRGDAERRTLPFDQDAPGPKWIRRTDPIWDIWLNRQQARELFVLVNLPGTFQDRVGPSDPRRLIVPLERDAWGSRHLLVEVKRSSVEIRPR